MEKYTDDTQVHDIVYVASFRYNNQCKTDNNPNELSWLEQISSNDDVCSLNPQLVWIEDVLDCIIDTFGNI